MKHYIQISVVFAVLLAVIPCIAFLNPHKTDEPQNSSSSAEESSAAADTEKVKIYFTKEKKLVEYTMQEYMEGAVLAQMPADFEPAALQAQAVLARTYALYRIASESTHPTPALNGAALSDDTKLYHGFFTQKQAEELYKDKYEAARRKVLDAVRAVEGKYLAYDGKPIIVAFHAVSDGSTRSAKDVWGQDIPYLVSVESRQDEDLKQAKSTSEFTSEQFREKLEKIYDDIKFGDKAQDWLKVTKTGEQGLVKAVSVCGKEIAASELCEVLDLASQSFVFEVKDGKFIFSCKGLGHLVGMSQYGANEMAKQGQDCGQILTHYFKGCTLAQDSSKNS